jgi:tRNA nucleotidyltransferase/poly(A) polymerase
MSDTMFQLESHLSPAQNAVVAEVQKVMAQLQTNVFLTGGALRDMVAGLAVRDLNFTLEGSPAKILKALEKQAGAKIVKSDEARKSYELVFPNGVMAEVSMARLEKYAKPGGPPKVTPASIHEDLRGRDFSMNCLAISLAKGSRGLLLDPTNGLSDLRDRILRSVSPYTLVNDPSRILKLVTLEARLGFTLDDRTKAQYTSAREAKLETKIPADALRREMIKIAEEVNPWPILEKLEKEKLLELYFPDFAGPKLNAAGFSKMLKFRALLPFGATFKEDRLSLFLYTVSEKWTPKDKAAFAKAAKLTKKELEAWKTVEKRAKALETALKSPKLTKPSLVFEKIQEAPLELILILLYRGGLRVVQDRIKNYLQKYLPSAMEVTDEDVVAAGGDPKTPKGQALRKKLMLTRVDARPKKVMVAEELEHSPLA